MSMQLCSNSSNISAAAEAALFRKSVLDPRSVLHLRSVLLLKSLHLPRSVLLPKSLQLPKILQLPQRSSIWTPCGRSGFLRHPTKTRKTSVWYPVSEGPGPVGAGRDGGRPFGMQSNSGAQPHGLGAPKIECAGAHFHWAPLGITWGQWALRVSLIWPYGVFFFSNFT